MYYLSRHGTIIILIQLCVNGTICYLWIGINCFTLHYESVINLVKYSCSPLFSPLSLLFNIRFLVRVIPQRECSAGSQKKLLCLLLSVLLPDAESLKILGGVALVKLLCKILSSPLQCVTVFQILFINRSPEDHLNIICNPRVQASHLYISCF